MNTNKPIHKVQVAILAILAIFAMSSAVWATDYYVDKTAGNDSNDGSISSPWQNCPGMDEYNDSGNLSSGDTVYFDSADTWTSGSGNSVLDTAAGVTYDGASWGSGTRAKLQPTTALTEGVVVIEVSNVTFKGFEVDGNSKDFDGIDINYPTPSSDISNITIENVEVHHVGQTDDYNYGIIIGSINGYTTSNVTIKDSVVHDTAHEGICLYPSSDAANQISNITVQNNEVYTTGTQNSDFGNGILIKNYVNSAVVEFNYIHDNPVGIQFEGNACCSQCTDVDIRHNLIKDNDSCGLYILGTSGNNRDADVYGNLFVDNGNSGHGEGMAVFFTNQNHYSSVFKFYNNTFYSIDNQSSSRYCFIIGSGAGGTPTIEFKNNIVYSDDHIPVEDRKGWLTHSNNCIYRTSGPGDTVVNDNGTTYTRSTLTNWEATVQNAEPVFINRSNLPTNLTISTGPNNNGLNIQAGSPAKENAANLGNPYMGSINLVNRPSGGGWDIGAYEKSDIASAPSPVQKLRIE